MARIAVDETIATPATSRSKSLRTTIPAHIVNQLRIIDGDSIIWALDKKGSEWIASISTNRNKKRRK